MRYLMFAVAVVLFCALAATALADTVYLKNGRKLVGKVTVKGDQVIIETKLGTMSFSRRQVDHIERDDKTLKVPKESGLPRKGAPEQAWKVLPDMPYHHVPYADIVAGDKLVAYNPRDAVAICGSVKKVQTVGEERTLTFEAPSSAHFAGKDAQNFSFYKIDTDATLAKLLFFGCEAGDKLTLGITGGKKRGVVFREISGEGAVVREGIKAPEPVAAKILYIVRNHSANTRALENYIRESKNLKEGDSFTFTESDGTVRMGKLVKGKSGLEIKSDVPGLKLTWGFVEVISKLSSEEYEARTKRIKSSSATYSPAVKPGDNVRAAIAAYGKAGAEGHGISGRIGIQDADTLGLYTRFFGKAGLWISSRNDIIYELAADKDFEGKLYGLSIGAPVDEALAAADIYFYRANANNPRIMVSDTLSPTRVEILLDPTLETIEKVKVTDTKIAGNWVVKAGMIMRPGK